MDRKVWRVVSVSGSIAAFHVGSGFASGQEILQFYTAYGPLGGLAVCSGAFILFAVFSYCVLEQGRLAPAASDRFQYMRMGGPCIGGAFYALTPLLMFLVLCVTVAGGGTALQTLFDITASQGRLLLCVPVVVTVLFGLTGITALSGGLGPVILLCALALGIWGQLNGSSGDAWKSLPHAASGWLVSAVSYACFGSVTQIPYLLAIGQKLESAGESRAIAVLGNGAYMLTGAVLHLGLCRCLPQLAGAQLPALQLARLAGPYAGRGYGIVLMLSIYTTAVPMLWAVGRAFAGQGKKLRYVLAVLTAAAIACVCGRLPFDRLLGAVYPCIGYVSTLLFAVILVRRRSARGSSRRHSEARSAL